MANRSFPNAEGILNATLSTQRDDGSWYFPSIPQLHETAIQVSFLSVVNPLYPEWSEDIQEAINKSKPFLLSAYKTVDWDDKTYGYFVVSGSEEFTVWNFYFGVLGVMSTELM